MQSLRAAVTILFAAAAFILPTVAATSANAEATVHPASVLTVPTSYAPDDNPWN